MWGAAILFIGIALINIVYMFRIKPAEMLGNYIKEKMLAINKKAEY